MKSMLIAVGILGAAIAGIILYTTKSGSKQLPAAAPLLERGSHAMG
jgi:hypothetical protein